MTAPKHVSNALGSVVRISSRWSAEEWGMAWRRYAWRMEAIAELAQVRAEMSEALLADALAELKRVKGEASGRDAAG